jgi:hypothetical protein
MASIAGAVWRLKRAAEVLMGRDLAEAVPATPGPDHTQVQTFDHTKAQKYEIDHNAVTIRETFKDVYEAVDAEKRRDGLWQSAHDMWLQGDEALWSKISEQMRKGKCVEIGSGPYGYLAPCYWIKDRVIIDPLVDRYREVQLDVLGKTFFDEAVWALNITAETRVPELVGKVDGAIICQNALDHCEDPLAVMMRIHEYAMPGCYLLLSTDLWHHVGLDDGHQNITREEGIMDALIRGLGFEIVNHGAKFRDPKEYASYVVLARKL